MLAALVELLFFFFFFFFSLSPPFFSSFLFPSCGLFVSRKCGAALEIPSRAEKHRNFCHRRRRRCRRRRRYRRCEFNHALIVLPIGRDVFIDPNPHFSFIDDFFLFDATRKRNNIFLSCYLFRIYIYIYIRNNSIRLERVDRRKSSQPRTVLNEGRGIVRILARSDRLEFKGCARRFPYRRGANRCAPYRDPCTVIPRLSKLSSLKRFPSGNSELPDSRPRSDRRGERRSIPSTIREAVVGGRP